MDNHFTSSSIVNIIIGIVVIAIAFGAGVVAEKVHFSNKGLQEEYEKVDSLYLVSHVVWQKNELQSKRYTKMFKTLRHGRLKEIKMYSSLTNPYWQDICDKTLTLYPYCKSMVEIAYSKHKQRDEIDLYQLYLDVLKVEEDMVRDIYGGAALTQFPTKGRVAQMEEDDLEYLRARNIWHRDSVVSQKYINFMIGIFSGNEKVLNHNEIKNTKWQTVLRHNAKDKPNDIGFIIMQCIGNNTQFDVNALYSLLQDQENFNRNTISEDPQYKSIRFDEERHEKMKREKEKRATEVKKKAEGEKAAEAKKNVEEEKKQLRKR